MEKNDKYEGIAADQEVPTKNGEGGKTEQQELENVKKERDDLYDRLLRKQAEFENYKKRIDREKSEFMQFASSDLMKELLNALDSFDLALHNAGSGAGSESTQRGFELIYKQLLDTMARFGLKSIEAKGKKFDPNFHQAVSTEPSEDMEENTVIKEMRKGYTLNGRLLRPAMVSVSVKG
jgi:molecular chaperone GrpE